MSETPLELFPPKCRKCGSTLSDTNRIGAFDVCRDCVRAHRNRGIERAKPERSRKVKCPNCGGRYVVTSKGKVHRHYIEAVTKWGSTVKRVCLGSGKKVSD